MARERPQKTLADYVAIAISPALIMLLVGSLAWFLLEVTYDARYASRIRWVLFWFVFGSVLVARIAIEQGRQYATGYWVAIGLAGAAVVFRLLDTYQAGALVLLGLIMWCSNKLTWDCTLIDDSQDASGEGLLQVSGFDETADQQAATARDPGEKSARDAGETAEPVDSPPPVPLWKRLFLNRSERENRPHAPGLWVVYFSLAALPLFGVGQLLIPVEETASRDWGFKLLVVYVAAGLGLLLTTSFLGLRRYLRQRKLKMPMRMTAAWLVTGSAMVAALLAVCLILPRPGSTTSISDAIDKVASKARDASEFAFLKDDAGENQGTPTERAADDQDAQQPDSGGQSGRGGQQAGQSDDNRQPAQRDGQSDSQGQKSGAGQAQGRGESGSSGQNSQQGQSEQASGRDQNQSGQQQQENQSGQQSQNQSGGKQSADSNQRQQSSERGEPGNRDQQRQGDDGAQQRDSGQPPEQRDASQQRDQERRSDGGGGGSREQEQQQQDSSRSGDADEQSGSSQQSNMPDSSTPAAQTPSTGDWIERLVKIVLYLIVAAVVLYVVWKYWRTILATLARMWDELRNLFASLFGGRRASSSRAGGSAEDLLAPAPPRPFASFDNPFHTGAASRMSPEQLVIYTFRALEAWGYDNDRQRTADQTPLEYAAELGREFPEIADAARTSARLLTRVAYAERAPLDRYPELLEPVWKTLARTARRPAMAT